MMRWRIYFDFGYNIRILSSSNSSRNNVGFPKSRRHRENWIIVALFSHGGYTFYPRRNMTEVVSTWFFTSFRTLCSDRLVYDVRETGDSGALVGTRAHSHQLKNSEKKFRRLGWSLVSGRGSRRINGQVMSVSGTGLPDYVGTLNVRF